MDYKAVINDQSIGKSAPEITGCLNRKRLFDVIDNASKQSALWINGPPAAGKSWAMASYIKAHDLNALWYTLDKRDNDPFFFFKNFSHSIAEFSGNRIEEFSDQFAQSDANFHQLSLDFFEHIYASLTQPFVLVFDHFQVKKSPPFLFQLLQSAIALRPENLRLYILSRETIPDSFSHLQVKHAIVSINPSVLEFTPQETTELLSVLGFEYTPKNMIDVLQYQYQGWIGGIVLQLQQKADEFSETLFASSVLSYFQHEFFSYLSNQQQNVLIKCAVLETIPESILISLTDNKQAISLFLELSRQGDFIRHHCHSYSMFKFQPAFREFILHKLRQQFSTEQCFSLQLKAANLLIDDGDFKQAAGLLQKVQALNDIEKLVIQQAPVLLEAGMFSQLLELINLIPTEQQSAWVIYWFASATLPVDPHRARKSYAEALESFNRQQDPTGVYMSWAGIVESFIFSWDDFKPLDYWITWMESFMKKNIVFPSAEVEARIVFGMFCSLMYCQPQHPDMSSWSGRLGSILEFIPDKNRRIAMATHYVLYLAWMGEFEQAMAVIERLKPSANIETVQPVYLIAWYQTEAMIAWLSADFDSSKISVNSGLALADKTGIHLWDFILRAQDAYLALDTCDAKHWQSYLQKILDIMDENGRLHQAHYYYLAALEALLQKKYERAVLHIRRSLQAVIDLGTPFPEALNCLAMARIQIEWGKLDEATHWLNKTALLAEHIDSAFLNFNFQLTQAEFYIACDKEAPQALLKALEQAMSIGVKKNYFNTDWWRHDAMCTLCISALERNIEINYVKKLIIKRNLRPENPPFHLENWPWKVRIYSLGRFSVLLDGDALGKQSKPIKMLKALIAFGGREVSEEKICEALWPDAEGDSAHSAFTTTLSRLRKLLGNDVLQVHDGLLSLNDHLCWLDVWAFERTLGELDGLLESPGGQNKKIQFKMRRIFKLYHGAFMEKENQMSWMLAQKGRLQIKFLRIIKKLIDFYSHACQCKKVVSLYEKALEIDPLSEEYYRGLMRCHAGQGNSAEALAIFNSCQTMLDATFNIEPSKKTQQLYQLIKTSEQTTLQDQCEFCSRNLD